MKKNFTIDGEIIHATSKKAAIEEHAMLLQRRREALASPPVILFDMKFVPRMVIFAEENGTFSYGLIEFGRDRCKAAVRALCCGMDSALTAERRARFHMAQLEENDIYIQRYPEELAEFKRWCEFQTEYRRLRAQGYTGDEAHAEALLRGGH